MATQFIYSIATDTASAALSAARLDLEIRGSSITIALDGVNVSGDVITIDFKADLSAGEETTLTGLVNAHTGESLVSVDGTPINFADVVPHTTDGRIRVAVEKSDLTKKQFYSQDWTDPTTWCEDAVRVVDEIATDSGDLTTWNLANANIIDTYHGKMFGEDYYTDADGHSFRVVVKVNDVEQTERDPHEAAKTPPNPTHGDYVVDYDAGTITFHSALTGGDVVKVTYHYENGSNYTVAPLPGTILHIESVEVQFSDDIDLTDSCIFRLRGLADVFAPQLLTTADPPGPLPPGTKIDLSDPIVYKTMKDYQADAVKAYATYPALGGSSWRGVNKPTVVFDWDYQKAITLSSAAGMEVCMHLHHNVPFGGAYATATLYCSTESEG